MIGPLIFYEFKRSFYMQKGNSMEHEKNQSNYWMTKTGQNIESRDIGFKSHRGHCDHSIAASTADCGVAHGVRFPLATDGYIYV